MRSRTSQHFLGGGRSALNACAWLLLLLAACLLSTGNASAQATTPPRPIAEVLVDADEDFVPDLAGDTVTVRGRALVGTGVLRSDRLDVFIQDDTGAIRLAADVPQGDIEQGQEVLATGVIEQIDGMTQLSDPRYRVVDRAPYTPPPVGVDPSLQNMERVEGRLARVEGHVVGKGNVRTGSYLTLLSGDSTIVAFIYASNGGGASFERYDISDYVSVTGVIGQYDRMAPYNSGYQIYPRYRDDIGLAGLSPSTYRRVVWGFGGLLVVVLAWVAALRQQVRRRVEELHTSELRYQMLFENAGDALFVYDLTGGATTPFTEVNSVASDLLGFTPAALNARSLYDLSDSATQEKLPAHLEKLRDEGDAVDEMTLCTKDGRTIPFEVSSHVLEMGRRTAVLSIARDITQRKRYEQGLITAKHEAENLARLKSTFLANMSHEIRTPLTSIIGFADVLADEAEGTPREFAQLIRHSGQRLMDTLNSVLDLARLDARQVYLEPVELDVVEEVSGTTDLLRPQAAQKNLKLRLETSGATLTAYHDPSCFNRVVTNLVGNAIKFTDEGEVTVELSTDADEVCLVVRDTGIGIDEAFLPSLFDEFKQESTGISRSHEGSGLGLSITRRLVEMMGGSIAVASRKGEGSVFTVRLPRRAPTAEVPAALLHA